MLHPNFILFQNYETSTEKTNISNYIRKDDELKGDNTTDENESKLKMVKIL